MKRLSEVKLHQFLLATSFPIRLHARSDLHLARKVWHMGMGLLMVIIYMAGLSRSTAIVTLASVLGLDLLLEMARLRSPAINERLMRFWGPIMRSNEINRLSGIPYYLAATLLAVAIFPKPIAVLSILYLAFGDPIASLFGILYGNQGPRLANGKSWIGTAAGVLTCMAITFGFLKSTGVSDLWLAGLTVVGGLAGGAAEVLPLEVDDNFSIPIVSGFILWLSFIAIGI